MSRYIWSIIFFLPLLTACSPAPPGPLTTPTAPHRPDPTASASTAYAPDAYRLQPGELILAAEEDNIPAILADDTLFIDAESGSQEWRNDDLVIGVVVEGDARAYPVRLLSSHEVVNDVVGGRPVAITWCPLCYSALVFDRTPGRELTFGVSGYLFRNNLVMYDHQTNTLWSQILAQGIRGALNGEQLSLVPSVLMEWGQWQEQYPQTRILSAAELGKQANTLIDPYAGYYASGVAGLTTSSHDDRLPVKELVVGLTRAGEARAYPLATLEQESVVNDRLATLPILLLYDPELQTVWLYLRTVEQNTLTFHPATRPGAIRDQQTGSLWDIRTGVALDGPLRGATLQRLSAPLVYWFAWSSIYPQTSLYDPPE